MVQKYQSPVRVYKYPFELVMKAYERRFPSCPQIPVVLNCEVISEWTSADKAVNKVERRCKLHVDAPYILKKIIGVDHVFFIQKNVLNLRTRTLDIEAYNESFQSRVVVMETCRYFVHPENSEWTCFEQCAEVDIHSFFGFENTIEKLAMKQYAANIAKGKEIIDHFMAQLKEEGITEVACWIRPSHLKEGEGEEEQEEPQAANGNVEVSLVSRRNSGQRNNNPKDCQYQLETEYIQRYLGQLTPMQESRLVQLRQAMSTLHKGKIPSEPTMLRFLRARDFNVEKAKTMLCESLMWRKAHGVDRVLSEYVTPQVVKDYFPGGWHYHDKDGRPVYLLRLGQMDVKGLLKSIGEDGLLKLTMHVCEEGLRLTEEATVRVGKPVSTWCLLVDLEGLNMRHLWRPGIKALLRIIEIVEANYPETLGRVLIIRAPRVFPILWTLVSTFIDEVTRTKFLFYGGNDYQEPGGLVDYIPQEYVPDFLGGPCKTKVDEGGLVPKSLYLTESELAKEGGHLTEDTIYHSVTINKGQAHEVNINIEDSGSVITWDFDVMKSDLTFTVLYSAENGTEKGGATQQDETDCFPAFVRLKVEDLEQDSSGRSKVEPSVVCRDGESIQGSHVASFPGLYTLHWAVHSPVNEHQTHRSSKLMYYYEVLKSHDYKGSMSSLQSANSSFSALSTSCTHQR